MKRALQLLAAAAACIAGGGWLLSATEHLPYWHGLYCSLGTATTYGCDVTPRGSARIAASALMLTAIPLLAGAFGRLLSEHLHVRAAIQAAIRHKQLRDQASEHHEALQRHVTDLIERRHQQLLDHVANVMADRPASATRRKASAPKGM